MPQTVRAALLAAGAVSLVATGTAQSDISEEELFELPPFTVDGSTDLGYQSSNTNSVSLVSTPIKDTPVSIEVLNGEVLRDLGLDNVNSAIDFATNAGNNEGGNGLQRNMNFRGLTTRFMRRNNFIWYTKSDNFSTDRVEVVRGPAALLYGDGEPGGLVNITSKKANYQSNFGEVALTLGSEGQKRATLDSNVTIVDGRLGLRIAGVKEDSDGWQDYTNMEKEGIFANVLFKPVKGLYISAEAEVVDTTHESPSIIPLYKPAGADWSMPITDLGFQDMIPGMNYDNITSYHSLFKERVQDWENYMAKVVWEPVENFAIEVTRNELTQTSVQNRFNGAINVYGPGEGGNPLDTYAMKYYPERFYSNNEMDTTRAVATYSWEMGENPQRVILGYIDESDAFFGEQQRPYNRDGNGSFLAGGWHALEDGPIAFTKEDIPDTHSEWGNDYFGIGWQKISPDGWTARPHWLAPADWEFVRPETVPNWWWGPILDERQTEAYFGALQNEFFDGKLKTLVGFRDDDYKKFNTRFEPTLKDEASEDSINAGFTYQINENVNAYLNYSETFKAAGSFRRDPYNEGLLAAIGEGVEGGIKYDLGSGWSGILTYYQTDFLGDAVQMSGVDRDIIDPNGINGRNGSNWVQADTTSEGVEIQAVGVPSKNLTVSLGFAYTDAKVANDTVYQIMFNDAFYADASGNPVDADGNALMIGEGDDARAVTLADIEQDQYGKITNAGDLGLVGTGEKGLFVNQVTGAPMADHNAVNGGERTAPYAGLSFNAWARYTFTEGAMKDWFLGGHMRFADDNYAGYTGSVAAGNRTAHERPSYALFGMFGGFERDYESFTFRAQVNIDNLFDKEYEHGFYAARWLQAPRIAKVTTTFSF
ncbi:TonB-dependent siderophore receptor [Pelagicoccus mobilis]|uniref:TonB-dependent receptor n=1 Tax=Pelagicoccus mobilis TaxID=415221 RepID=A0A934RSC8_9BACT|nr:TonB-dependent receptor [Pelagicoccus mobilis]MBK1875518.1 TonB-dependent receptor [Pelagicoccus mobilis]